MVGEIPGIKQNINLTFVSDILVHRAVNDSEERVREKQRRLVNWVSLCRSITQCYSTSINFERNTPQSIGM